MKNWEVNNINNVRIFINSQISINIYLSSWSTNLLISICIQLCIYIIQTNENVVYFKYTK